MRKNHQQVRNLVTDFLQKEKPAKQGEEYLCVPIEVFVKYTTSEIVDLPIAKKTRIINNMRDALDDISHQLHEMMDSISATLGYDRLTEKMCLALLTHGHFIDSLDNFLATGDKIPISILRAEKQLLQILYQDTETGIANLTDASRSTDLFAGVEGIRVQNMMFDFADRGTPLPGYVSKDYEALIIEYRELSKKWSSDDVELTEVEDTRRLQLSDQLYYELGELVAKHEPAQAEEMRNESKFLMHMAEDQSKNSADVIKTISFINKLEKLLSQNQSSAIDPRGI